jgi:hypothetical protein
MTDEAGVSQSEAEPPAPDRYYAEHVSPALGTESLSVAALQEAMNEGSRKSWRLVGVANEPTGRGLILVWDQQGFVSG